MFGRSAKVQAEQGADRRRVQRRGSVAPPFSYYTSRVSGPPNQQAAVHRHGESTTQQSGGGQRRSSSFLARLPVWLLAAVVVVCVVKILALSTSPKVVVVGRSATAASYLQSGGVYATAAQKLLAHSFTNRSKLTVNLDAVSRGLKYDFPELQDVSIGVPLVGNRPVVYIQPAVPSLVVETTHGNYLLNGSGVVLAAVKHLPTAVPLAVDQSGLVPSLGKRLLPAATLSFMQVVSYQLAAAHLSLTTFVLPAGAPYELDVRVGGEPYVVRFSLEASALTQSGAAIATIQQLGSTVPSTYIDVRVPGRVYYK